MFAPGVIDGESGSPLVDGVDRLVGVVVAGQDGEGVAVTAGEVASLLGAPGLSDDLTWPDPPGSC